MCLIVKVSQLYDLESGKRQENAMDRVDVVIVGAGLAGLSAARKLTRAAD